MGKKLKAGFTLCAALMAALALLTAGCTGGSGEEETPAGSAVIQTDGEVLGNGSTAFSLTVTDADGGEIHAEIRTDEEIVGEALEALGVIAGEESPTGLYVKTVNGITADYEADGTYWAFYVGGEYAQTGVDSTPVTEGGSYAFKVEQG